MRLMNADELKISLRIPCRKCPINGTKVCKNCEVNECIELIDKTPTVAITDKPLAIIEDKVIYMTRGHVNALIDYEREQAAREVCERIMNDLNDIHKWENEHGKK